MQINQSRRCRRSFSAPRFWPAVLAAALAAAPAAAQFGGGFRGLAETAEPQFTQRDVAVMVNLFQLDQSQRDVVESFVEEYRRAYDEKNEQLRDEMSRIRRSLRESRGDMTNWRERIEPLREQIERFRDEREALRTKLLKDVQSVLYPEQREKWPTFERMMRRQQSLPMGILSGESVDLFRLVEEAHLDEAGRLRIEPVLNDYELQLDAALIRRDEEIRRGEEEIGEAIQDMDFDRGLSAMERQRTLRVRVRDLNDRYARLIAGELAEPESFMTMYREKAFPEVYRDTYGEMVFAAAASLTGLDESVQQSIAALRATFEQRLQQMNARLERITREEEPQRQERFTRFVQSRMSGESGPGDFEDPIRVAFDERREFEDTTIKQLHALLQPEQIERLPKNPNRPGEGWRQRRAERIFRNLDRGPMNDDSPGRRWGGRRDRDDDGRSRDEDDGDGG